MNWTPIDDAVLETFRDLIQIDTTNPPGNEVEVVRYLSEILTHMDIPFVTAESEPGRANLVARLPGKTAGRGILMTSHVDVVAAEPSKWTCPPFAAEIRDGYLYGRGAVDMKNMTAMALATMIYAKKQNVPLERDLVFSAVADEEAGCAHGSRFLAEQHPDWLEAEYAVNELGGYTVHLEGQRFYPIQVAEKGLAWLEIKVQGEPGHGSMPHPHNAIVKLAEALRRLDPTLFPHDATPVVREFVHTLASALPFPRSAVFKSVLSGRVGDYVLDHLFPDKGKARVFWALTHDTLSPTMLAAGRQVNVIPSEAVLHVDCRILPGHSPQGLLDTVQKALGPEFTVTPTLLLDATVEDYQTDFYRHLARSLEEADPGARAVPFMIPGFTDAKYLHKLGIKTYGFAPVKLPPDLEFNKLYHGHDERIPVDGFLWGLHTFMRAILTFAAGHDPETA